jgi:16S rRNA (guanine966-N2)-methyltransferase
MRVVAGQYRSRPLQTLRGSALRPTSDRLRETLFNILAPTIEDAVFVDLFAGSGAVGIEALSRGARQAIFVENHPAGIALLRRNLSSLGIEPNTSLTAPAKTFPGTAELLSLAVEPALERLAARHIRPDIVFADPPYADGKAYDSVLEFLGDSNLLAKDGRAILEHSSKRELPPVVGTLERTRVVNQGDSTLSFYHQVRAA